jgi:response regulator RpfG family c-di-GMP phosphodiesterase
MSSPLTESQTEHLSQPEPGKITAFIIPEAPPRILLVDDDESMLFILQQTIAKEGYEVETAFSAAEALQRVRQKSYALVMTDQRMPGMTGVDLLSQIQDIQPDTTRILITGVVELNTVIDSINKGEIYRFLMKPWLNEELLLTVRNGVQRYELIRRNAKLHDETVSMNERLVELNEELRAWVLREEAQNLQLAKLNNTLQQNLQRSIELCLKTMESFHPTLGAQARRVHSLCCVMAETLGLTESERHVLEISAWLHDIGLLAVPRSIIKVWEKRPEDLNARELKIVQQHPVLGQELARFVHDLASVGLVIRAHHERFDGKGFPDGLSSDAIPWLGRLLAVAVAYAEAEQKGEEPSVILRKGSGKQFDPEAVKALISASRQHTQTGSEREVLVDQLKPGMTLAQGIYNSKGKLMVPAGEVLSKPVIQKLQKQHRTSPIQQSLFVQC